MGYVRVSHVIDTIPLKSITHKDREMMHMLEIIPSYDYPATRKHLLELIDKVILDSKSDLGTNVHDAIYASVHKEFPVIKQERGWAYFDSYHMWAQSASPEYLFMERHFKCDKIMLEGTCDGLARFPNGDFMIIDFKTSATVSLETWTWQAHGYYYLLHANGIVDIDKVIRFVNLRVKKDKNGMHPAMPKIVDIQFDPKVMAEFLNYVHLYWEDRKLAFDVD